MDALRQKVEQVARASPLWEGGVVAVQVTDFREFTMEVRILVSARNASRAFDLRCLMREEIVAFLQKDHPGALPRLRNGEASGNEHLLPPEQRMG